MKKEELKEICLSESDDFENAKIIYEELYLCYFVRKKDKKPTVESFDFERNAGVYINMLVERIRNYSFRIEKFNRFKIRHPDRIINAPDEVDRLGEFWICVKYIKPYLMGRLRTRDDLIQTPDNLFPRLFVNNMACQDGKGSSETMRRLSFALSQAHILYGNEFYVLQYDMKKFYDNIEHNVAKKLFSELPRCAYKTVCNIIDSYHCTRDNDDCYAIRENPNGEYGVPKGTLISQWVGVMLLDPLDKFITERLGAFFGIRYMDDGVYFFRTKYEARDSLMAINKYIESHKLGIKFNEEKTSYYKASRGINFCGWFYKVMPDHTVIKRLITDKKKEQYGNFKTIQHMYKYEYISLEQAFAKIRGIFCHLNKGDTFRLRLYYQKRFSLSHDKGTDLQEVYNEEEKSFELF